MEWVGAEQLNGQILVTEDECSSTCLSSTTITIPADSPPHTRASVPQSPLTSDSDERGFRCDPADCSSPLAASQRFSQLVTASSDDASKTISVQNDSANSDVTNMVSQVIANADVGDVTDQPPKEALVPDGDMLSASQEAVSGEANKPLSSRRSKDIISHLPSPNSHLSEPQSNQPGADTSNNVPVPDDRSPQVLLTNSVTASENIPADDTGSRSSACSLNDPCDSDSPLAIDVELFTQPAPERRSICSEVDLNDDTSKSEQSIYTASITAEPSEMITYENLTEQRTSSLGPSADYNYCLCSPLNAEALIPCTTAISNTVLRCDEVLTGGDRKADDNCFSGTSLIGTDCVTKLKTQNRNKNLILLTLHQCIN